MLSILVAGWSVFGCFSLVAEQNHERPADARTQEQVWQLLQKVIGEYWNGESKNPSATNSAANDTNVEAAFRAAAELMPQRLDLKFGVASALIGQAAGTNGQRLELKVKEALNVYREIEVFDTNGFDAALLFAAYSRAIGETNAAESALNDLMLAYPGRTREYLQRFARIDTALQITANEKPPQRKSPGDRRAIVVLGAGLETNGTMKAKLVDRLKQCRKLARTYPEAPIILTGGNQKGGITEAYAMKLWCLHKGISKKRILLEDKARDTVENALYCSKILKKLEISEVTLVTSVSHMRRGLADFEEACLQRGLSVRFSNLASRTKGDAELDKEQERLGVYRDVLRTSGLWTFPGIQR